MRFFSSVCVAALAATGCATTNTTTARRQAQASLRPPPLRAVSRPQGPLDISSCSALADSVANQHPRVRALEARGQAALARSQAEGSLPAPKVSLEVWDFPIGDPARSDREGMYMMGVTQEFGPPGVRDSLARVEAEEARAMGGELAEAWREVRVGVAEACAGWSTAEAVRERLTDHRNLLSEMRAAMVARYQSGGETLGVVTRADGELAAADRHVAEAEEEVAVARATLAALAGDVALPKQPPPLRRGQKSHDPEKLIALAKSVRGQFAVAEARRRAAAAKAEAARAEARVPSFELGATYMQTPSMRAGLGAMVSMSIPWLWGGAGDRRSSADLETKAAVADAEAVDRTVRVEIARAAGQVKALERSLELLVEREIPAAHRALEAERAALNSGDFNLASWIQAGHAVREAHVDEARIRGALENAWIALESSVGRSLRDEKVQP